jgi:hypothetical protein
MAIGAHHTGQRVRIAGVAFGARGAMPLPVAGHLPRVDREHPVPGGDQCLDPPAAVGLDPDRHLARPGVLTQASTDQLVQPGDPRHALRQPRPGQPPARLILQLHAVVIPGPAIPRKQHVTSQRPAPVPVSSAEENTRGLTDQCSRHRRARHPISGPVLLASSGARSVTRHHITRLEKCSPTGRYRTRVCPKADPVAPH